MCPKLGAASRLISSPLKARLKNKSNSMNHW